MCDRYELRLSTDSSGPQLRPVRGEWGYRGWRDPNYQRPPVEVRGLHRARHVALYREFLVDLRQSGFYHHPDLPSWKYSEMGVQPTLC